ncbi:MAG: MFS transporter [Nitrososphaerales archaeon]
MDDKRREADFSKNVVNLGLVSFFTDISTEMVLGILPLFIIGELGASKAILGLIEGLGEFVSYVSRTFSGAVSDKIGRRKSLVIAGYALSTASKPLFALSSAWTHALVVRVSDRVGKGVRTAPRDALLSDSVRESVVGRAFGIHRSLDQAGAIAGPVLAFALMPLFGIRGIFWLSFIPGIIALMILLFLVRERKMTPTSVSIMSNFRYVLREKFSFLMSILILFSLGAYNFSFVLLAAMELEMVAAVVPLVYAVINVAHTSIGYPSGMLSDKIGGEKVLAIGFSLFFFASFIGFMIPTQVYVVFIMAAIFGLYLGISETVQRAIIPKYSPSELRGTAYGIYYLFVGISFLIANAVFGTLWDQLGAQSAFTYSLIMSGVAIIGLMIFSSTKR